MFLLDTQLLDQLISAILQGTEDPLFEVGAAPLKVKLVLDPYTPSKAPNPGDIIYATFDGYATKSTLAGGSPVAQIFDSYSGRIGYLLNEPAGGFRWICTDAPLVPEVVVGVVISDAGDTVLWSGLLDTPRTISQIGDFVELTALLGYLSPNLFAPL